jgi:TnpA family transposase
MSRRHIFTERQRAALFDLPTDELSLLKFYTLGDDDLENIRQRRRPENRIGFALQLCALRYPGRALAPGEMIPREVLSFVGAQLEFRLMRFSLMPRRQTRQQHMDTLREIYGYKTFTGRGARDLRSVDFRPGRRCQIKRGSCSSFYCAVSGNFHHSARSIDNRALVRGCSGRR